MFSKKRFLQCISYGSLLAATALSPMASQAQEKQTIQDILENAEKKYQQAYRDVDTGKMSYKEFLKAEQDYASVMADYAPTMTEEDINKHPLFKNRAPRDLSIKDRVRQMTPEEIKNYHTFLQKRLEVAEQRLPNKLEKGTQKVTNAIDTGSSFLGNVVSTPLGWIQNGLQASGEWINQQLNTVSEKTGDTIVSPLIGTAAKGTLSLTGNVIGSAGRLTDTAVKTTSKTLTNTLRAAATMTRSPKEAGLNLAANTVDTVSHTVGDTLTEAGTLVKGTVNTVGTIGKQSLQSATEPVVKPTTYLASKINPTEEKDIQIWGAVSQSAVSSYPIYPLEKVGAKVARTLTGTGQGINLVSEAINPLLRGNASYMSPQVIPETVDATISYLKKTKDEPIMHTSDLKAQVMTAMVYPYIDNLTEEKNAVYQHGYMAQMRGIFLEHGAKAEEKRITNAVAEYALAKENLKEFEQAVQEVQKEKEDKNISISKAIQNKGRE